MLSSSFGRGVKRKGAFLEQIFVSKFRNKLLLFVQNLLKFAAIEFAFNGVNVVSANFVVGFGKQVIVNVSTHGALTEFNVAFRLLFTERPIVGIRNADHHLRFPLFIEFGLSVLIGFSGTKHIHLVAYGKWRAFRFTVQFAAVVKTDAINGLSPAAFRWSHSFDSRYLNTCKYGSIVLFLAFAHTTKLVVTSFCVEIENNPSQFLAANRLRQGFFAQIEQGPVVGHLATVCHELWLMYCKIGQHFAE